MTEIPITGAAARRARNREEMYGAILGAARQIVDEQGADKLTLRGIAQQLGYSAGAIYDYFASKEDILEALYFLGTDGLSGHMAARLASLPADTPTIDALVALAETYREYAHAHVDLYWLTFSGLKHRPEPIKLDEQDNHLAGFAPLLEVIHTGIANGALVDDIPPFDMAVSAWSAVHGFVSLELSGHMKDDLREQASSCLADRTIQKRDDLFATLVRMVLSGFLRRD